MRMAVPADCVGQKWRAAFDSLAECITFFFDDPTQTTTQSNGYTADQDEDWLKELKSEIDETQVDIFIGMGVVV